MLPILTALLAAASPAPTSQAPTPNPAPAAAPAPPTPTPTPSIDTILSGAKNPAPASDDEDQPAASAAPAPPASGASGLAFPTPYTDLDAKAYSDSILAAARAEQAMQGPLDGGWSVTDAGGRRLFSLRMVDHGQGVTLAEGAWLDLTAAPGPGAAGFVESIGYDGDRLMLRFHEADDDLVVLTIRPSGGASWSGDLLRRGTTAKVTLSRD
jgi:hypothetical protein